MKTICWAVWGPLCSPFVPGRAQSWPMALRLETFLWGSSQESAGGSHGGGGLLEAGCVIQGGSVLRVVLLSSFVIERWVKRQSDFHIFKIQPHCGMDLVAINTILIHQCKRFLMQIKAAWKGSPRESQGSVSPGWEAFHGRSLGGSEGMAKTSTRSMKAFWAHRQNNTCLISAKKGCIVLLLKPKQLLFNVDFWIQKKIWRRHLADLNHWDVYIIPDRISTLFKDYMADKAKSHYIHSINPLTYSTSQSFIPRLSHPFLVCSPPGLSGAPTHLLGDWVAPVNRHRHMVAFWL